MTKSKLTLKNSEAKVLECLRHFRPISRAKIAISTGLSKPVVSQAVEKLIKEGIVKESKKGRSTARGGKRPTLLEFNPNWRFVVGVDVGGSKIRAGLTDLDGNLKRKIERKIQKIRSADDLIDQISSLLTDVKCQDYELLGIGVGVPGTCDRNTGKVRYMPAFDLRDVPLETMLEAKFGVPVFVENDVTLNALGEMWKGAAKGLRNVLLVSLGTGTGAGLILNGALYTGSRGMAGEIGYLVTDWSAEKDLEYRFGRLERWFSGYTFERFLEERKIQTALKRIFDELESHPDLNELFNVACEHLALAIANAICLLDPDVVVLSGGIGYNQYDKILAKVEPIVSKTVPPEILEHVHFKRAELAEFGVVMGAVCYVQKELFVI
ncbi:ROK family transcriptional regulator [Pseudothermotoga sp.]